MSKAQQGSTIECFAVRKSIRGKYHVTITSILLLYLITLYVRLTYLSFPTCRWLWWLGSQLLKNSIQYQCLQHLFGSEKVSRTLHSLVQRLVTLCEHNPGKTLKLQDVSKATGCYISLRWLIFWLFQHSIAVSLLLPNLSHFC